MSELETRGLRRVRYEEGVAREALDGYAPNPHQRNTNARAPKAGQTYLAELEAPHLEIAVVHCLENEADYMLNGHTRRDVWNSALIAPSQVPSYVNITFYEADTIADVVHGYEMFDSAQAVKTSGDEVFGALRQCGYHPRSPQIANAGWLEPGLRACMALAHGIVNPVKVEREGKGEMLLSNINEWLPEITALDEIGFGSSFETPRLDDFGKPMFDGDGNTVLVTRTHPQLKPVNFGVPALMALRRDGEDAMAFLTALRDSKGTMQAVPGGADRFDAIRMVHGWAAYKADAAIDLRLKNDDKRAFDWAIFFLAYDAWLDDRSRDDGEAKMFTGYPRWSKKLRNTVATFHPFAHEQRNAA